MLSLRSLYDFRSLAGGALLALLVLPSAGARTRAPEPPLEQFTGCTLQPHDATDGDSFLVRLSDGRTATFRLYFVDAAEAHLSGERSTRQARYFRVTPSRLAALGREARAFTARALAEPFTLYTRWQSNFDEGRYFAFVRTSNEKDLAELLVRNGLALPRGERTHTPYGRNSRSQHRRLKELERLAQAGHVGAWARERS